MARPTTLTEELIAKLETAVYEHPSKKLACQAIGISFDTFRTWLLKSKQIGTNPIYVEFAERIGKAEAKHAKEEFAAYKGATKDKESRDGRTILEYLCRRFPSIYNDIEIAALLEGNKEINAHNRAELLDNPPPKMLAEFTKHGYWKFPVELEAADRAVLETMRQKYAVRVTTPAGEKPCLITEGTPVPT